MSQVPFRFAPVPHEMLFDGTPPQVVQLYAAVYRLWDLGGAGSLAIGQAELAQKLGWSDDTVARWARKAKDAGWLVVRRRGQGLPNEYAPLWPEPADLRHQAGSEPATVRTPSADLRVLSSISERSTKRKTRDDDFATWYQEYPVHKARGDAEKAWRQMNGDRPALDALLAATRSYAMTDLVKRGFGKHPATWLRAKCWLDEETNGHGPPIERCPQCDTGWGDDSVCFAQGCPMMVAAT